ncbi:MAG: toxin-antitoxin system HicB family antitoxin [Gammaproteobacteria bacterium]|nr:toxin-antitoxin system HicB family antitoxin [Gammaproteobacteria bacterium]
MYSLAALKSPQKPYSGHIMLRVSPY